MCRRRCTAVVEEQLRVEDELQQLSLVLASGPTMLVDLNGALEGLCTM